MASLLARTSVFTEIVNPKIGQKILALTTVGSLQTRNLNVQEHVSYTLLNQASIPTPKFGVAKTAQEAFDIASKLNTNNLVLKAQVLAGGRGKGAFKNGLKGGVRVVYTPPEAKEIAGKMVNQLLVTKQTGAAGRICNSVMVAERKFPRREFYFAVMMERAFNGPVIIASSQGGVNIEEVAAENPDAIVYEPVQIQTGLTKEQALKVVKAVGLSDNADNTVQMLMNMYELFVKKDALLIEINPYAEDAIEGFFALDAKFRFDDNAEFRQKELFALRDWTQEDPKEVEAAKFDLNYIALDGTIGCMVNGAGLAMATMDIIKLYGGDPANFLDVGGGATAQAVKEAFKIITSDPKVHCILVNIFGGIMRCDVIAEGIIAAAKELNMKMPIVVRLQGTNVNEARELIRKSGLRIIPRHDLDEAANLSVHLAKIVELAREMNMDVNFEIPDSAKKSNDKCASAIKEKPKSDKAEDKCKPVKADKSADKCETAPAKAEKKEDKCKAVPAKAEKKEGKCKAVPAKAEKKEDKCKTATAKAEKKEDKCKSGPAKAEKKEDKCKAVPAKAEKKEDKCKSPPAKVDKPADKSKQAKVQKKEDKCKSPQAKADKSADKGKTVPSKAGKKDDKSKTAPAKADKKDDKCKTAPAKAGKKEDKGKSPPAKVDKSADKSKQAKVVKKENKWKSPQAKAVKSADKGKTAPVKAEKKDDKCKTAPAKAEKKEDKCKSPPAKADKSAAKSKAPPSKADKSADKCKPAKAEKKEEKCKPVKADKCKPAKAEKKQTSESKKVPCIKPKAEDKCKNIEPKKDQCKPVKAADKCKEPEPQKSCGSLKPSKKKESCIPEDQCKKSRATDPCQTKGPEEDPCKPVKVDNCKKAASKDDIEPSIDKCKKSVSMKELAAQGKAQAKCKKTRNEYSQGQTNRK